MSLAPGDGERAALRGYRWQYDHIATRVYDAIREDEFVELRLTDPEAGEVDDLVLVREARVDAYQFKSTGYDGYLTFGQIVRARRPRGSRQRRSLIAALADGWGRLRGSYANLRVHLVAQQLASNNDHLVDGDRRPSPDHFAAFLAQVLVPLGKGEKRLHSVGAEWEVAIERMRKASGLSAVDFEEFVQSLEIEVGAGTGSEGRSTRSTDVRALSDRLHRLVSEARSVVELDRPGILQLMNWTGRIGLRSPHEFPVDLDTHEPLTEAVREAGEAIARQGSGYVAVVGPPGAGKSSLLTQALTGSRDRVLRYYAYVPGTGVVSTRLTARGFLHDLIVMLGNSRVLPRDPELAGDDIDELRRQFADHLDAVGAEFSRDGVRTLIVVDGLDHVEREYDGTDSLLGELPRPDALPHGDVPVGVVGDLRSNRVHQAVEELKRPPTVLWLNTNVVWIQMVGNPTADQKTLGTRVGDAQLLEDIVGENLEVEAEVWPIGPHEQLDRLASHRSAPPQTYQTASEGHTRQRVSGRGPAPHRAIPVRSRGGSRRDADRLSCVRGRWRSIPPPPGDRSWGGGQRRDGGRSAAGGASGRMGIMFLATQFAPTRDSMDCPRRIRACPRQARRAYVGSCACR